MAEGKPSLIAALPMSFHPLTGPDYVLHLGDVRDVLPVLEDNEADCCVTSPPYMDMRAEYGTLSPSEWRSFFHELRRVVTGPALFNCGRLWRNGVESDWQQRILRIARREGWEKLDELIWLKSNANPIQGKVFTSAHEYVFVLGNKDTKLNTDAIRTEYSPETLARFKRRYKNGTGVKGEIRERDGRDENHLGARAQSFLIAAGGKAKGNPHPAPMPLEVAEHLVRVASFPGQVVLDPFMGSGTTAIAARRLGRRSLGVELNHEYAHLCASRLTHVPLQIEGVAA